MSDLLARVCLPVASVEDAQTSCAALVRYDPDHVVAVHVIEKAGGAPDKASIEQREAIATEIFSVVTDTVSDIPVETDLRYGTDVAESIFEAASEHNATAIAFTPRSGSRWIRLLTGDVAMALVTRTDRPVVVLPDVEEHGTDT